MVHAIFILMFTMNNISLFLSVLQVRTFGFSDVVGLVSYPDEENREYGVRPYSENLDAIIETEVSSLIFSSYKKTEEVLKANMDKLKLVSIHSNYTVCSFNNLQEGGP